MKVYYNEKTNRLVLVTEGLGLWSYNDGVKLTYATRFKIHELVYIGEFYSGETWSME